MRFIIGIGILAAVFYFGVIVNTQNLFAVGLKKNPSFDYLIMSGEEKKPSFLGFVENMGGLYLVKSKMNFIVFLKYENKTKWLLKN